MECKCEHCGKMTNVVIRDKAEKPEAEEPEVEVSIEGDAKSIREILTKLMPGAKK